MWSRYTLFRYRQYDKKNNSIDRLYISSASIKFPFPLSTSHMQTICHLQIRREEFRVLSKRVPVHHENLFVSKGLSSYPLDTIIQAPAPMKSAFKSPRTSQPRKLPPHTDALCSISTFIPSKLHSKGKLTFSMPPRLWSRHPVQNKLSQPYTPPPPPKFLLRRSIRSYISLLIWY